MSAMRSAQNVVTNVVNKTRKLSISVTKYYPCRPVSVNTQTYETPIFMTYECVHTRDTYNFAMNLCDYIAYCAQLYPDHYVNLITYDAYPLQVCILHSPNYSVRNSTMNYMQ